MKIRSMTCLIKKPVEFKERVLNNRVIRDRFINGYVIKSAREEKCPYAPKSLT